MIPEIASTSPRLWMAVGTNPGLSGTQLSRVPVSSGSYLPTRTARDSSVNPAPFPTSNSRSLRHPSMSWRAEGKLPVRGGGAADGPDAALRRNHPAESQRWPGHPTGDMQRHHCSAKGTACGLAPNAPPAAPRQPKWVIATSDVLAPSDTLLAANNELRLQQQGAGSGDDGNLLIVETNCAARRA